MGWLQRSSAAAPVAGEVAGGAPGDRPDPPTPHDSPALAEILTGIDENRPLRVLDLGPAQSANLDFYSSFACGIRIAHLLRDEIHHEIDDLEPDPIFSILDRLSPADDESFDLVLVWDLLNYLVREQPKILTHHLAAVSQRGARIHAMIFTTQTMPSRPSRYEFTAPGRLLYRPDTRVRRETPDPPAALVERWLDPFRITRSFLLRHGVREFIGVLD